ncbi:MAG TPA: DUF2155 domain-containing protein [Rhizomicrobium sp.]|nr:DUF2155 domain-containing protein [Rhizomicrobium sp.]
MKRALLLSVSLAVMAAPAFAQTAATNTAAPAAKPAAAAPGTPAAPALVQPSSPYKPVAAPTPTNLTIPRPYNPMAKVEQAALDKAVPGKDGVKRLLILRGLDKITGKPANILAPVGVPVPYATLTITGRYCYSTPITEPPETTAFLQIEDHRPDQAAKQVFSGWMLASSPSLNGLQHPLYDVWVMACATNQPGQQLPLIASTEQVKSTSPDATAKEALPELPEGSGQ